MPEQTVTIRAVLQDALSPGLARIRRGAGRLLSDFRGLARSLAPVAAAFTSVAAAGGAAFGFEKSIDLAETQVQQERRLLNALDERLIAQRAILDVSSEIQAVTQIGDEVLIEQAALMRQIGVNAQLIPDALRAAVQVAEALGIPIEQVARDIAILGSGGEARTLPRFINELRTMREEGASTAEIIQFLQDRFEGAAEAAAETDFGRVQQELNLIGDAGERLGEVLVRLKLGFLQNLRPVIEGLADFAQSGQGALFVDLFLQALPIITKVGTALAIVLSGLSGLALISVAAPAIGFLASLATNLGVVAATLTIIGALLTALGAKVLDAFGKFDDVKETLGDARDLVTDLANEFGEVIRLIGEGKLEISDLFDLIFRRVDQLKVLTSGLARVARAASSGNLTEAALIAADTALRIRTINEEISDELAAAERAGTDRLANAALAAVQIEQEKQQAILRQVESFRVEIERTLSFDRPLITGEELIDLDATQIREILGNVDTAVLGEVQEILTADFEDQLRRGRIQVQEFIRLRREIELQAIAAQEEPQRKFVETQKEAIATLKTEQQQVRQLGRELDQQIAEKLLVTAPGFLPFASIRQRTGLSLEEQGVPSDLQVPPGTAAATRVDTRQQQLTRLLELAREREQVAQQEVELAGQESDATEAILRAERRRQELLLERVKIEQELRSDRVSRADSIVDVVRSESQAINTLRQETVQLLESGTITAEEAVTRSTVATEEFRRRVEEAQIQLTELLTGDDQGPALLDDLERLRKELEAIRGESVSAEIAIAQSIRRSVEVARQELSERRQEIGAQESTGSILPSEAVDLERQAIDRFVERVQAARDALAELAAQNPELAASIDQVRESVDGIAEGAFAVEDQAGGFFSGAIAGAKETAGAFDDLRVAGLEVGSTVVDGLATGLANVFVRPQETMREFLAQFLQTIAVMLARIALLRAFSAGLNALFPGAGSALAAAAATGGEILPIPIPGNVARFTALYGGTVHHFAEGGEAGAPTATQAAWAALRRAQPHRWLGRRGGGSWRDTLAASAALDGIRRYAGGGGVVPGPDVRRDIVPALLMPKEWVIPVDSVEYYGRTFMEGVRRRAFPRELVDELLASSGSGYAPPAISTTLDSAMASGGEAAASSIIPAIGALRDHPMRAVVVSSEEEYEMLIAGATRAYDRKLDAGLKRRGLGGQHPG